MAEPRPVSTAQLVVEQDLLHGARWQLARCAPDAHLDPRSVRADLEWLPARVPGTAASALCSAGRWSAGQEIDFDAEDWWFSTSFQADSAADGEQLVLVLEGVATVAEVFLNGTRVLESDSMFALHEREVGALLAGHNELAIRCRALAPLLQERRKPRARWRAKLTASNLRFFRTMLLGRAPGFAPGPAAVGPWRPVRLVCRRVLALERLQLRPVVRERGQQADGLLAAEVLLRELGDTQVEAVELALSGPDGAHLQSLTLARADGLVSASGVLTVPDATCWWPHTHGEPTLHQPCLHVRTTAGVVSFDAPRVGFRTLTAGARTSADPERDGLDLHVNGVRVFARGAVWTPPDFVGLAPDPATLRATLERMRDAGMNMVRIAGTGAYESAEFHDLCDELGLLLWQDFMFANHDYPIAEERFRAAVLREARTVLDRVAGRPSLAVLCGNSEIEQQVAMLGLDPALGRGELFGELLPGLVAEAQCDAIYLPSAPCGGARPFVPDVGVANYFGVGGYRRPLEDVRRAEVRFAAECLALSNVPDEAGVAAVLPDAAGEIVVHHPRWKAGVPRDAGAGWDFEDVRDHYLGLLFDVEPAELRRIDHERYLELSRAVSGELMAEVFGEWRRSASPCGGGLVLWLGDLRPGAGWGILDHSGRPKVPYHHLRRALAPVAVWMTDEGLGGIRVHVANELPAPRRLDLRVSLYTGGERRVAEGHERLELGAHDACERDVEALIGHFADASWAYRFGPAGHDVVVATLADAGAEEPLAQAFRFPAGRPLRQQTASELGLTGTLRAEEDRLALILRSTSLAYGVRVHVPGHAPSDDALTLEPGVARRLALTPGEDAAAGTADAYLTAINLRGRVRVEPAGS